MIGVIWSFVVALVKTLFGVGASKDPSTVALSASNATAQAELSQQEAANAVLTKATAARTAAADGVLRDVTSTPPASVNDTLKRDFPADFRD